jgi:hypothetical protein
MSEFMKIPETLIPLSHLALDLEPPAIGGWHHYLSEAGIAIVNDDLGRDCVARADARRLFEEKRAAEQRAREMANETERLAIERDQAFRATLNKGIPWYALPAGVSYGQAAAAAEAAEQPQRVPSHGEWLFGETDTMVYHELPHDEAES